MQVRLGPSSAPGRLALAAGRHALAAGLLALAAFRRLRLRAAAARRSLSVVDPSTCTGSSCLHGIVESWPNARNMAQPYTLNP